MENINFLIVGKPNSGKSTFYNTLNNKYLSPTGPESGLTKDIFKNEVSILDTKFTFFDTPGLRRKNKICLLYTSPSPRDGLLSRMPSSA